MPEVGIIVDFCLVGFIAIRRACRHNLTQRQRHFSVKSARAFPPMNITGLTEWTKSVHNR